MDPIYIKNCPNYIFDSIEEYKDFCKENDYEFTTPKNWREANELDWVFSDDGRIIQVLAVKYMKINKNADPNSKRIKYVRTAVGTFKILPNITMDTDPGNHENRYKFGKLQFKERKLSRNERILVAMIATGKNPVEQYLQIYKTTDRGCAEKYVALLLGQERIKRELSMAIKELATTLGLTEEYYLKRLKEISEKSRNEKVQLDATIKIGEAIGVETKKELPGTQRQVMFQGFKREFFDDQPNTREIEAEIVEQN